MQWLDVLCVGEAFITAHTTRRDSYQRLPPAKRTDSHNGNSLVPKAQAFHRLQYRGLGTRLICLHSELRMRTLTAAKWRRVSSSQMK